MTIKQTIRCDNCNKLVKELWTVNINKSDWEMWELQFCSKNCVENHKFKLIEEEIDL